MRAKKQGSRKFLGPVVALLLLVGATVMITPNTPTWAGPPDPTLPQPEPFYIHLDKSLAEGGAGREAISMSQAHVTVTPGTWYDLYEQQFDDASSLPAGWTAEARSGPAWAIHDQEASSPAHSAGVTANTETLDTWLFYGGNTGFPLEEIANARLTFSYWLDTDATGENPVYFGWAASPDGRAFYGARISGQVGKWLTGTLDLRQYINDDSVWIAFFVSGTGTTGTQKVYVDDVKVQGVEPYDVYLPMTLRNYEPPVTRFTFTDDFSDTNSGWPNEVNWGSSESTQLNVRGYTNKLMADYADGQGIIDSPCRQSNRYFMRIGNPNAPHVIAKAPVQADEIFSLEVDIAFCDGAHNASTGILFGLNDGFTEYYRVILIHDAVDNTTKYAIWRRSATENKILVSTSSSAHLNGGYYTNHVKIVRDGCNISIYFNGHLEKTLTNECSYTDQRWVGFFHDRYSYYSYTGATAFNFQLEEALKPKD